MKVSEGGGIFLSKGNITAIKPLRSRAPFSKQPLTAYSFSGRGGALWLLPPPPMKECLWTQSSAGGHYCCEFMSAIAVPYQEDRIPCHPMPIPWSIHSFWPFFQDVPEGLEEVTEISSLGLVDSVGFLQLRFLFTILKQLQWYSAPRQKMMPKGRLQLMDTFN